MADSRRSGDQSGVVVKNRSSSGCLIVRKKSDDVSVAGSSGARKALGSKKGKKRPRVVTNDSGSSDDLLVPPRRRVGPETIRVCNDLSGLEMGAEEESNFGKEKDRDRLDLIRRNEDGLYGRTVGQSDRKRNRLDVFEFDESEGSDKEEMMRQKLLDDARMDIGGRRFFEGSMALGRGGIEREFETGSNRQVLVEKRKNLHLERTSSFNQGGMNRFGVDRNPGRKPISSLREKYAGDSDEPIRLQGKNGVLKVMVNKKKKVSEPVKTIDHVDAEETQSSSRIEEKAKRNVPIHPSLYSETEILEKPGSSRRTEKKLFKTRKSLSSKNSKDDDSDSNDSATVMNLGPKRKEACKSKKEASSESEKTPVGNPMLSRIKEGKVTRGSGTEKQKLRERIRGMLVEAGWTIDYRPRKNRDYLDAVYINPAGTAYWSIIKAYDALMKQLNDEEDEAKHIADCSPFTPLPDEVLSQLTRKTRKKIEKEMRKKQIDVCQSLNRREPSARRTSSARHDDDSTGSDEHEEKLSSFLKQGGKSSKSKMNENGVVSQNLKGQSSSHLLETDVKPSLTSSSHLLHGRKSKKLGRCTLLVRSTNEGSNSGTDGFVPYTGKRTLLSWLIDSGTVQLSQKVQYMNRRRTKVLLEGWVTRDGIHCGCCSKILTVSKFEIHAGSKLRQPFQNIYLDLGVSLLQCQIDAWTRLEESESIGFDRVDTNGDDPNDDTCGICGDGGNLICCDGCPSTFHQSCLDIQILPPGDWHCPNCTCKFCGLAGEDFMEVDGTTTSSLLTCNICEKKYHKLCMQEVGVSDNLTGSATSFCGHKCLELSEHLQKYLGVKHELESGFSWSLIHRSDEDSDTSLRGLPHRVECNAKLAVALTVMDECFLPIVDRRSGINLIRNVLYNSGSNFSRLNYSGFYTAILERGDEIISAASIRFHGTQLAEMPFIGTRHIYRHQGMCRRLFCALESALCTLKVEKLIIPAIAELRHTWTVVFGFTPLEESLRREIRSLNVLVFPGVDMLQKRLVEQDGITNISGLRGLKQKELKAKHETTPEMANKANIESSTESKSLKSAGSDLLHSNAINGAIDATDFDSKFPGISSNSTSTPSGLSPVHVSDEGTYADSNAADKLVESASVGKGHFESDTSQIRETEVKPESDSTAVDITQSTKAVDMDVDHAVDVYISAEVVVTKSIKEVNMDVDHAANVNISASHEYENPITTEEITSPDSQTQNDLDKSDLNQKRLFTGDTSHDAPRKGNEPEFVSPVDRNTPFATECDIDNECDTAFTADGSHEVKVVVSVQETPATDSRDKSPESASAINCASNPENISGVNMENEQVSDSPLECNIEPCKDGSIEDNFAAAPEVGIVVSVEGTVCSDSRPEDKLTECASIRSFIFDKSPCMPHGKSNAVDLFVKDESQSCKEDDMNDSPAIDVNTTAREFVQPISVQGFKSIELYCGDELDEAGVQSCREGGLLDVSAETESASERDCVVSKTDAYEQYREHNPSSDSPHCKLDNSDDKHPNAAPPREITVKNTSEAGSGISAYASTRLGGSDMSSSMHVVNGQKSTTSSESGSEAAHREASSHHPSSDVPKDNNEPSFA